MDRLYQWVKRGLDLVLSLGALILLWPVLALISLAILLEDGPPVLFGQQRIGKKGKAFKMFKFRTMVKDAGDQSPITHEKDPRITKVGRFLRRWSLDELAQLFNVLKGDMSLVGPRPTLRYQVDRYTPEQMRRLCVLPGITGLAQVSGRNALSWEEKIALDLRYVENASLWLDLKIMFMTLPAVLRRDLLYRSPEAWRADSIAAPEQKEDEKEVLEEVKP